MKWTRLIIFIITRTFVLLLLTGTKDNLQLDHDANGTIPSSAGVIELNENTTSLTIKSANLTSHDSSFYMYNYWYVTGPTGKRIKVNYENLQTGDDVGFVVYDDGNANKPVSRFSNPFPLPPVEFVFTKNTATFYMYFSWATPGEGVTFTVSITGKLTHVYRKIFRNSSTTNSGADYFKQ